MEGPKAAKKELETEKPEIQSSAAIREEIRLGSKRKEEKKKRLVFCLLASFIFVFHTL